MNDDDQLLSQAACARLCTDFANFVDSREYDRFVELFTEDAVFDRMGVIAEGRQAIRAFLDARPAGLVTRHVCTNIAVDIASDNTATGISYAIFFNASVEANAQPPFQSAGLALAEYHDVYTKTAEGWRIRERRVKLIFKS